METPSHRLSTPATAAILLVLWLSTSSGLAQTTPRTTSPTTPRNPAPTTPRTPAPTTARTAGPTMPRTAAPTTPRTPASTPTPTPAKPSPSPSAAPTERLKFRLVGYPRKHNEGRIEVFYKGEWGTICDDDFSLSNAQVLCRQLGFVSATGWTHSAKYGKGQGKIWLDNVLCNGGEKSIEACKSRGWGNSDCTHDEDAGVVCKDERIPGFVDSNVIDAQVDENKVEEVRLRAVVNGAKKKMPVTEGVVEVKHKDGWVQICDLGWTAKNTRVVCGMLGFPHERKVNKKFYKLYLERQKNHYLVHSVACTGTEVHLAACPLEFTKPNATSCAGGMPAVSNVRLKGGARTGEGRVEVLKNNAWGTVCDDRWSLQAASVVCRELGFGTAKEAINGARMGQGMGPIHMNEVRCVGLERSIWGCPFRNVTQEDCSHTEDAAVRCNVPYMGLEHASNVRLKGGARTGEGRVEVLKNNAWGTVCDDRWSLQAASVVCRGAGLRQPPRRPSTGPAWAKEDCSHTEDAAVRCNVPYMGLEHERASQSARVYETNMFFLVTCSVHVTLTTRFHTYSRQIRLTGGRTRHEGRVEVLSPGPNRSRTWGLVCGETWGVKEVTVACRQLGLGYANQGLKNRSEIKNRENAGFGGSMRVLEGDLANGPEAPSAVGGRTNYEGRVEVQVGPRWGTVCSAGWTTKEAMVVCRQLGLGYSMHAVTETWYWDSSNVTGMVLSGVKCTGDEMALSQSASDLVLNAPMVQETVYIEDRPLHMLYCAAEENCLSKTAAAANWPYGHRRLLRFSSQIHNIGRADFRPKAGRHSWVWHACHG
ncbi:hypothetical protein CRUP_016381 [Coryphaenoides rupestris]|nr:hypothetical protein CRUP_016381 [Coryphaenoides rupestris]